MSCYICGAFTSQKELGTSALTPNNYVIYIGWKQFVVCRKHYYLNKHLHYDNYSTNSKQFKQIEKDANIIK